MEKIIKILMERDGLTEEDAREQAEDARQEIYEAIGAGCFEDVEDILASDLGLELDYIFDILSM
ncbi:MAG: hypothetical protein WC135_09500 [Bacteroidales bacterium]